MKKLRNLSLGAYLNELSIKTPVPGGGSAAAYAGALGTAVLMMVASYSVGRAKTPAIDKEIRAVLQKLRKLRDRLLVLVDLDAQMYLGVVKARKKSKAQQQTAQKKAQKVSMELCRLCYDAVGLAPFLANKGNVHLISDVAVASELLFAAFNASLSLLQEA